MRQEHRAGEKLFIDFCGPTVPVINPDTGEIRRVAIFVAVMGASNYTYVEACEGQDMMSWLNANSRCLSFLGGVPKLLIPDNLKSAVKKADRYEPVINDSYQALAEHYGTVIIPARPYKPKDKPKAENGVLIVERWLLARIRNETFYTLRALNTRLRELLTDMNNRPMKGYGNQTRAERFRMLDTPALSPLPLATYEYTEYKAVKVGPDYHVEYARHWYSVPVMRNMAGTISKRLYGILNAMRHNVSNGNAEALNSKIRLLRIKARGYRNRERFKLGVMFHYGKLNMSF